MTWNRRLQRIKEALPWRRSKGDSVTVDADSGDVEGVGGGPLRTPRISLYEGASEYVFEADVPGASAERTNVSYDGKSIVVTATSAALPAGRSVGWPEHRPVTWHRRVGLPQSADPRGAKASVRRGVLTVRVPKQAHGNARRIEVEAA